MDWWRGPLRELVDGRRAIVAGGPAAVWTSIVETLRQVGASDVLVVATEGTGVGPQPNARTVVVEKQDHGADTMAALHAGIRVLGDPPPHVVDAVEAFDPDRTAVVFSTFLGESPAFVGRPFVAHRRPEWVALEDKTRVDELLDRAGVPRVRSTVVPIHDAVARWRDLDDGAGTVWAADATAGFHGGGARTRWVTDDAEAAEVSAELAPLCHRVRVMPFLDGIATSVHGIVLPDGVIALRPVELVTLRQGHRLLYSGCATFWDPPDAVREEMRDAARRVGAVLRADVGFRGVFTVDGVATADGFRPTEVNPRFGAGLGVITRGLPDVSLYLVLDLVVAGIALRISAAELESEIVALADASRSGGTWQLHVATPVPVESRGVRCDGGRWRWAVDGEDVDGTFAAGAGFARLEFVAARTPVGPSVGPRAAAFWRFADEVIGTGVGLLTAAPDVARPAGSPELRAR